MIQLIEHNPPAYFYMNPYEIWPAQHDSNVRPGPVAGPYLSPQAQEAFISLLVLMLFADEEILIY